MSRGGGGGQRGGPGGSFDAYSHAAVYTFQVFDQFHSGYFSISFSASFLCCVLRQISFALLIDYAFFLVSCFILVFNTLPMVSSMGLLPLYRVVFVLCLKGTNLRSIQLSSAPSHTHTRACTHARTHTHTSARSHTRTPTHTHMGRRTDGQTDRRTDGRADGKRGEK